MKVINEKFWTENIYPKIKNLGKIDQAEVITELKESDISDHTELLRFLDYMLADYNQEIKMDCKSCLGSDIHSFF